MCKWRALMWSISGIREDYHEPKALVMTQFYIVILRSGATWESTFVYMSKKKSEISSVAHALTL